MHFKSMDVVVLLFCHLSRHFHPERLGVNILNNEWVGFGALLKDAYMWTADFAG